MADKNETSINQWQDNLLARGAYGAAKEALHQDIPDYSEIGIKRALNQIVLVRKGSLFLPFLCIPHSSQCAECFTYTINQTRTPSPFFHGGCKNLSFQ